MEWVHIIEDIEVADFLNGNELVMTTGIGNINTPDNIMKYAKKLYEKHCSCLIINIGPYIKEVPRVLIDFCNENNMPLFTVPWEVQLVNMTRWFCEILIENAEKEKSLTSLVKDYLFKPEERSMLYSNLTRHGFSQHLNYCVADFGLVGESGCGKSVTSQSIMRLYDEKRLADYEGEIILDQCKVCRLAMNHDGYPYLVPMNFGYEREGNKIYLYFHGANAGTKKELIEKDGRVAFEMDVHEEARISSVACNSYMDYESVCGTGNAEIADDTQKRAYLEKIMRHYTDIPFEMLEKAIEKTMVIRVEVVTITGKFHRTGKGE